MTTLEIVQEFTALVNTDQEYTLLEMKKLVSDAYKARKAPAKAAPRKRLVKKDAGDSDDASGNDAPKKRGRPVKVRLNKDGSVKQKKAPSAYNLFIKGKYAELKPLNEGLKAPEIMKLAAAAWRDLSDDEKDAFKKSVEPKETEDPEDDEAGVDDVVVNEDED